MSGPLSGNAAKAHDLDGTTIPGGWYVYPELIAAGLWTTPSDLARLIVEVQKASSRDQGAVLTRQTAVKILTRQPNSKMGLGFNLMDGNGGLLFNHAGANVGYKGFLGGYTASGAVVMTNGDNGIALAYEVLRSVARVYGWPDFALKAIDLFDVSLPVLEAYAGNYSQTGGNMGFQVYMSGVGLMMRFDRAERLDMYPIAKDIFLLAGLVQGTVTFSRDASGNITGFTATTGDGTFVAKR